MDIASLVVFVGILLIILTGLAFSVSSWLKIKSIRPIDDWKKRLSRTVCLGGTVFWAAFPASLVSVHFLGPNAGSYVWRDVAPLMFVTTLGLWVFSFLGDQRLFGRLTGLCASVAVLWFIMFGVFIY